MPMITLNTITVAHKNHVFIAFLNTHATQVLLITLWYFTVTNFIPRAFTDKMWDKVYMGGLYCFDMCTITVFIA